MKSYLLLAGGLLCAAFPASAQRISGTVFERSADTSKSAPLTGANVYWLGTSLATSTDTGGKFSIARSAQSQRLVVSFVGYKNDTIRIGSESELEILLQNEQSLGEVTITENGSSIDRLSPHQTEIITTRTLAKAACCNLSESFETNASVSVSYADAVTGTRQIQMLGLSGTYIQTNLENIPAIRGLGSTFGLSFVPGTWIQSIDIGKGAGSVVNGYESMTGQINVELQKPDIVEKLYLNTYINSFGRGEVNLNLAGKLGKKWSTGLLTHTSTLRNRFDKNKDGFLDLPLYTQFNALNRWKYQSERFMAQFGVQALHEDRLGGQNSFIRSMQGSDQAYGFGARIGQYSFFSKMAKLFPEKPYKGLGLIINASLYDSRSFFGLNNYDGRQGSVYGNLIYQSIISSTDHSFKTGLSYRLDRFRENYATLIRSRTESVPGVFFEYTYNYLDRFVLVAGGRADFHNLYGTQWTPRLHLKYNLTDETTLRASAGRGFRVANPLAEYYGNLVSSRLVRFTENIRPEVAWNMGASLTQAYQLGEMKGSFVVDFYRTHFENQLIADFEDPRYIRFYNLHGRAYANSFQAEANLMPAKRFELKLAYRLFDVKQTQRNALDENALLSRAMLSRDRVLFNAGYALPYDKWKFDATVQWNGRRRMPYMGDMTDHHAVNPVSTYSPSFYNINAQVTRTFPKWDVYLGGENLTNFRQQSPIMGANDPFGTHFDAGMAWGPVTGRMIYAGMRYKIGG